MSNANGNTTGTGTGTGNGNGIDKSEAPATATATASAAAEIYSKRPLPACARCHDRKVKCDVSSVGLPCANCSRDAAACALRSRKSYAPRKRRRLSSPTVNGENGIKAKQDSEDPPPEPASIVSNDAIKEPSASLAEQATDVEEDSHHTSPLFVGDQQGIGYGPLTMGGSDTGAPHLFVEEYIAKILGPEELEYLSKKGVFTLPVPEVTEALIRAYFRHIHPLLPVVDAATFLNTYDKEGLPSLNLLLMWSMFAAAASFLDGPTLAITGFATHKKLKESLVKRAKSLFDIGSERDKIILIQSALLLSLWFADIQDVFQTWHWTGIAINMSLNLGLHRNPDYWRKNPSFAARRRQLWRRLWWTTVFRDRWASLSMGRPIRVNLADCDVPLPNESDVSSEINEISESMRSKYWLSADLSRHWVCLVDMSNLLAEIITTNYRPKAKIPSQQLVTRLDTDVLNCIPAEIDVAPRTPDESYYLDHLKLHQQVALIVLYRRYVRKENSSEIDGGGATKSRFNSREKIKAAATRCNTIVEHIVESHTTHFMTANTIALLAPPMTSHLMEAKAQSALAQKLARSRLDIYFTVLSEFEENYPVAAMLKTVYLSVRDKGSGKNLSQELIALRRADHVPTYQRFTTDKTGQSPRQKGWDDLWLLEPFANFHWDSMTPDSDNSHHSSYATATDVYQ